MDIKQKESYREPKKPFVVFSGDFIKKQNKGTEDDDVAPLSLTELKNAFKKDTHTNPVPHNEYLMIYQELKEMDPNENIIWMGRSTQLIHLIAYIFCILFGFLIIPLLIALYLYLQTKRTIYVITNERIRVYSGILIRRIDDVELYRVKDTIFLQPILLGFFGYSNIQLITSDSTWGNSVIQGITNGRLLREKIRNIVEKAREKKGVREVDYYTFNDPPPPQL
jgi:membrane protein YdbS with pleckstrin-like domain